ncbi:MAG: hypothetical protein LBP63_08140 [Prevotellaceae bacterium]|jgi:hypothetical protein|nr:hypothetical protein [Prevotellaceae bacterium]
MICFIILFFASCSKENMHPAPVPEPELPQRTIIGYLCGDNDLSSEINEKITVLQQGMQNMGQTENHLIVYADYNDKMPKLIEITSDNIILLKQYVEQNSASAANFAEILKTIMTDFPAKSYGLICFSHANGWLPQGALNNPQRFATANYTNVDQSAVQNIFDDNGNEMTLSDFSAAIPSMQNGDKFEFIIFEMCYMSGIEVAYELRNKTRYIISSAAEILSNGFVEIYPEHLSDLFASVPLLQNFACAYFDYRNGLSSTARSATVSLINTDKMEDLANIAGEIYDSEANINIDNIQHFNRNKYHLFFDLSDYIQTMANPQQLTNYQNIISQIIEYQAATPKFMTGYPYSFIINNHCGITTYIKQSQFPYLNSEYDKTAWSQAINSTK